METLLDRLTEHLDARSDEMPRLPMLFPADAFLDTVGEAMRRRLFVCEAGGRSLCLRPEFTIPLCLHHIESDVLLGKIYAAAGTVFRQDRDREEFPQAGLEWVGHMDTHRADAGALTHMVEALELVGVDGPHVTVGDKALFAALLDTLDLTETWRARLLRAFGDPALDAHIAELASPPVEPDSDHERLALDGDAEKLTREVEDLMKAGGLTPGEGRDPAIVAARMIERTRDRRVRLDPFALHVVRSFLGIDQPLVDAVHSLETLAEQSDLDMGGAVHRFSSRLVHLDKLDLTRFRFRAGFGRALDYYTGLLFEAAVEPDGRPVAGGGRYDRLCSMLGATTPIPAVGFTIMLDRVR